MPKVLTMLVALVVFCAVPAVAIAQDDPYEPGPGAGSGGNDTVSSGNTQNGDIDQDAHAGSGGNAGNQACLIQQNAGRDANAACNQEQNFTSSGAAHGVNTNGRTSGVTTNGVRSNGVGTTTSGGGVGGGGVQSVTLARTGFDAWVLALLGGLSVAGGLGLFAAQRRGRLSS